MPGWSGWIAAILLVSGGGSPIIVRDVTLVDVASGDAIEHADILIEGSTIVSVARGPVSADGAEVVDGTGLFAIPGLFDAHVHYSSAPDVYDPLMIANGVVCVRDTGSDTGAILALRDDLNRGRRLGPEMLATGAIVDGDPPVWPFSEAVDTEREARDAVKKLSEAGVDQIKVYSRLEPDVWRAAIDEAHARGLKAIGHVPEGQSVADALDAGQDGVEHLSGFDVEIGRLLCEDVEPSRAFGLWPRVGEVERDALDALYRRMADAGVVHCPTLVVMAGIAQAADASLRDPQMLDYAPRYMVAFWTSGAYASFGKYTRAALPFMQQEVARLHAAGVEIVVGTDLANPFVYAGFSVHEEMRLLQQAGIAPIDVLRAATIVPARYLGVADRLGSIGPGKTASFVLLREDPRLDVGALATIDTVFLRGRRFDRAQLDDLLATARAAVSGEGRAPATDESASDPAAVELSLPGEEVARGTLKLQFSGFDAGTEEFLITRVHGGYRMRAKSLPEGGFDRPALYDLSFDGERRFVAGTKRELVADGVTATYAMEGAVIEALARRGANVLGTASVECGEGAWFEPPLFSSAFFTLGALSLAEGSSTRVVAAGIAQGGWKPLRSTVEVRRLDDEAGAEPGGRLRVFEARYSSTTSGETTVRTWIDARGIVSRASIELAVGEVTAALVRS